MTAPSRTLLSSATSALVLSAGLLLLLAAKTQNQSRIARVVKICRLTTAL